MGWERRGSKMVYYREVREGGRVRSVYCGGAASLPPLINNGGTTVSAAGEGRATMPRSRAPLP